MEKEGQGKNILFMLTMHFILTGFFFKELPLIDNDDLRTLSLFMSQDKNIVPFEKKSPF